MFIFRRSIPSCASCIARIAIEHPHAENSEHVAQEDDSCVLEPVGAARTFSQP